jgi:L-malate glycosyltransferase
MKVLFLTPWYPDTITPHHGVFIRDQAVAMARDHEVVLVSSKVDYTVFGILSFTSAVTEFEGVKEHRIVTRKSFPVYNQLNYLIVTLWYTRKVALGFRPDIIHGNIGYPSAFWSWVIGRILGVPYVITEHSTRFDSNLRSFFHRMLTLAFMKKASAIMAVSNRSAADIYSFVRKQPVIVPNIIVVQNFKDVEGPAAGAVCHFGFLGGLEVPRKGLDILLKAVAGIGKNFLLHIGGKGKLLEHYKALALQLGIEKKCEFYGFIPEGAVPDFMGRLHFFVSASRAEGFGMVIAEAMACGLPVVATRSGGPDDYIGSANGILVPPEDIDKMREALEWMIENYASFDKEGIGAFVAERYSPEVIVTRINDVYAGVVGEKHRSNSYS